MNLKESFLLLALVAEIIGTIGGVGSSVFFVPIGNFYFDFYTVLGLTAVFHLSSNLSKIFLFKKGLNKFLLLYIGAPSVVFVILGGYLSKIVKNQLRKVPALSFYLDDSLDHIDEIDDSIKNPFNPIKK